MTLYFNTKIIAGNTFKNNQNSYYPTIMPKDEVTKDKYEFNLSVQVVFITTDKFYENLELGVPFVESHKLGIKEPYNSSKAASEILISAYIQSFFKDLTTNIATARAGNVIGGLGDKIQLSSWLLKKLK